MEVLRIQMRFFFFSNFHHWHLWNLSPDILTIGSGLFTALGLILDPWGDLNISWQSWRWIEVCKKRKSGIFILMKHGKCTRPKTLRFFSLFEKFGSLSASRSWGKTRILTSQWLTSNGYFHGNILELQEQMS